jgi:cation:H+ antiporter
VLYLGGRWTITGASQIALHFDVRPYAIGLTIVAFGTSLPELFVGIIAMAQSESLILLGNVVGSNITDLTLVLGACAVITPIMAKYATIRREAWFLLGSMLLFLLLAIDGEIGTVDGFVLIAGMIVYLGMMLISLQSRPAPVVKAEYREIVRMRQRPSFNLLLILAGVTLLVLGGEAVVTSAIDIARSVGLSELVIALTLVAIGTNIPELVVSLSAAIKRKPDIALGNAIGSCMFNTLVIVGVGALIAPFSVSSSVLLGGIIPMIGVAIFLLLMLQRRDCVCWKEGIVLLSVFSAYVLLALVLN